MTKGFTKRFAICLICTFFLSSSLIPQALARGKKKTKADKAAEAAAAEKARKAEELKLLIKAAKEELNNTAWKVRLTEMLPLSGGKKKSKKSRRPDVIEDTLRFVDNKIESTALLQEGFSSTNFTVRLKGAENEITVWETMQTSEKNGVAFWRGEIKDDVMRGVLSRHISENNKKNYNFMSTGKEAISEPLGEEASSREEIPAPAIEEPAAEKSN